MIRRILILLAITVTAYGQQVRGIDLHSSAKDTIRAIISDSLASATNYDSVRAIASDTADVIRSYVRTQSGYYFQFYTYQDPAINSSLQMQVRDYFYLHDKYWSDADYTYHYEYSGSGDDYNRERKSYVQGYMEMIMALHEATDREIYLNELINIYQKVISVCETTTEKNGSKTCYTIPLYPDVYYNGHNWSYTDCVFHRAGIYIYNQDNSYSSYLQNAKDFADVAYSWIDKDNGGGWAWEYYWDNNIVPSDIEVNMLTPFMEFYSYMKANSVYTSTITSALIDTLCDSIYYNINRAWVHDSVVQGDSCGGWEYTEGDGSGIKEQYMSEIPYQLFKTMENLGLDTTWQADFGNKMQKAVNWISRRNGNNVYLMQDISGLDFLPLFKMAQKYGFEFSNDTMAYSWMDQAINPNWFNGSAYPEQDVTKYRRWQMHRYGSALGRLISNFNDNAFSERYSAYAYNWTTNQNFYFIDGHYIDQVLQLAPTTIIGSHVINIGFQTNDGSTNGADPDTCDYTDGVLTWPVPQSGTLANGRTYTVYHRMGSPFFRMVPSTPDSLIIYTPKVSSGETAEDYYLFYYNAGNVLDTLHLQDLSPGDSVFYRPNQGAFIASVKESVTGQMPLTGWVYNSSSGYLHRIADGGTISKFIDYQITDVYVSKLLAHGGNLYQYGNFDNAFDVANDYCLTLRQLLANGLGCDGVLRSQTQ